MKTALGVIDVQNSLIDEGPWQPEQLLERVEALIQKARAAGAPIVFVTDRNVVPDGAIHPRLSVSDDDLRVEKSHLNAFEETPLDALLRAQGVTRFVVAGLQTDYCVNATCRGGAALGYDVVLVSDAHSTNDAPDVPATQIIAEHNTALSDLKLERGSVRTEPGAQIVFKETV
jgi:nicotinamidase-related amidase